jgi:hypothetical protein
LFLRVSGTLRNPLGNSPILTMPRTAKQGTCRVEFNITPESLHRLDSLKKSMKFKSRDELLDALLYKVFSNQKIDPYIDQRLEQKIDYLIERIDLVT